ncbi:hypothetical protein BD626DRAFT_207142 [Schizophyllum amplum]|uniref:Uncharacterized protein n=1 Tax=Schizophyllum amplum TaxID=97359 RepID=A0A550BZ26_9AGAR|nr:hypothetical protein BD626DRAFT_207142 [Auriculariopsis ampla]
MSPRAHKGPRTGPAPSLCLFPLPPRLSSSSQLAQAGCAHAPSEVYGRFFLKTVFSITFDSTKKTRFYCERKKLVCAARLTSGRPLKDVVTLSPKDPVTSFTKLFPATTLPCRFVDCEMHVTPTRSLSSMTPVTQRRRWSLLRDPGLSHLQEVRV